MLTLGKALSYSYHSLTQRVSILGHQSVWKIPSLRLNQQQPVVCMHVTCSVASLVLTLYETIVKQDGTSSVWTSVTF